MGHWQISNPQAYRCHQEKKITSMQDNGYWYMKMKRDKRVSLWRSKVNILTKYSFLFWSSTTHNWTEQICHNQVHPIKNQISPHTTRANTFSWTMCPNGVGAALGMSPHLLCVPSITCLGTLPRKTFTFKTQIQQLFL
jgi:hypothetical protein